MQDLFATRLYIATEDPAVTFAEVRAEVFSWAWRGEGEAPDPAAEPAGERDEEGTALLWRTIEAPDHPDVVLRVQLRHADSGLVGIQWVSMVDIVCTLEEVRVGIRLARTASELRIAPAPLDLHPPRLVGSLIARHATDTGDGIALACRARYLQPDDIVAFIQGVLTLPTRRLPVLLLSPPAGAEAPATDPDLLASELAGLAHVYVLSGRLAWERLRDEVGPGRVVPGGGARLYWPGFTPGDQVRHPYWNRRALPSRPGRRPFRRQVFDLLAPLSVLRMPVDSAIAAVRAAETVGRLTDLQRRTADAAADAAVEDALTTIERLEASEAEVTELRSELEAKNEEILRHRENWAAVRGAAPEPEPSSDGDAEGDPSSVSDWREVSELVEILADSGAIVFTDDVRRRLPDCPYPDPDRMYAHLEALAEAAEDFRAADASLNGRFEDWIAREYGLKVAMHDEGLARDGGDSFIHEGINYSRQPHVKVDDGVPGSQCGRIYFALDSERRRLVVDHVGLHL